MIISGTSFSFGSRISRKTSKSRSGDCLKKRKNNVVFSRRTNFVFYFKRDSTSFVTLLDKEEVAIYVDEIKCDRMIILTSFQTYNTT